MFTNYVGYLLAVTTETKNTFFSNARAPLRAYPWPWQGKVDDLLPTTLTDIVDLLDQNGEVVDLRFPGISEHFQILPSYFAAWVLC